MLPTHPPQSKACLAAADVVVEPLAVGLLDGIVAIASRPAAHGALPWVGASTARDDTSLAAQARDDGARPRETLAYLVESR